MKSKEYVEFWHTEVNDGVTELVALERIAFMILIESKNLVKVRRVSSDDGLISIMKELNIKFISVVRQLGIFSDDKEDIFKRLISLRMPELAQRAWYYTYDGGVC